MTSCTASAANVVQYPRHDIFLSHSGAQKDFAIALSGALRSSSYSTFLDVEDHSLPPGLDFPSRIFHASKTCRLALLVISEEYVSTKWPMLELCAFVAAAAASHEPWRTGPPQPLILPLFFKLAPSDLKQQPNQDRWQAAWQQLVEKDPSRINFSEWHRAFKMLFSQNGIEIGPSEDQPAYIDRICSKVCNLLRPSIRHDYSSFQGIQRMSQAVLAKIKQLNGAVKVMGMYGLPGSGKSTICSYLCDDQFTHFRGKTLHLELPVDPTAEDLLEKSKKLLTHLTDFNRKLELSTVTDLSQVYYMLKHTDFLTSTVFLVVDNISCDKSVNAVAAILRLGLAAGSVVLLVARTLDVLEPLLGVVHHENSHSLIGYGRMSVPSLTDEEALRVLLQFVDGMDLPQYVMKEVVSLSGNGPGKHLPLMLQIMGVQLIRHGLEKWSREMDQFDWTRVWQCKEKALEDLVLKSFNDLSDRLQHLFLDLALFILPLSHVDGESNYNHTNTACVYLGLIHGGSPEDIEYDLNDQLQRRCFLTIVLREAGTTSTARDSIITMHDVYLEFATSIKEAASKYFWSPGHRWSRAKRTQAIEVQSANTKLRTVVLELDEWKETFVFSHHFSGVKAMVLRNCKSLKSLGGLENLDSLVSLQIHNCPSLKWMESPAILSGCWPQAALPMLQRIDWVDSENVRKHWKYQCQAGRRMLLDCPPEYVLGRPCRRIEAISLVLLQIQLRLQENTGSIRHLVKTSGCYGPQLTTHFPKLELFGDGKPSLYRHPLISWLKVADESEEDHELEEDRHHHLELGRTLGFEDDDDQLGPNNFLVGRLGCPELQDVCARFASTIAGPLLEGPIRGHGPKQRHHKIKSNLSLKYFGFMMGTSFGMRRA